MKISRIAIIVLTMLVGIAAVANGQGQFCGAVGTPGCNAVYYDSSIVVGWATGCTIVRGPVDIVDPEGPRVHYGEEEYGIGPAGTITTEAVSLGDGGMAILTFAEPIRNGNGPDFAVYENSFSDNFLELAFVEVSSDGERYVRFPATSLTQTATQIGSNASLDPTMLNNLAGKFRIGYGTPFDLEELRDSSGIDINNITHVRLVDVVGTIDPEYATYDAFGHIVNDPYPTKDTIWGSGGFDLTGVAVLSHATASVVGISQTAESIYPNPATNMLNISGATGKTAVLYDATGRKIGNWDITTPNFQITTASLKAGVYILRVGHNSHKIVKK